MSLENGSTHELSIESLASGGRGVARVGGQVWFVEGGVPGDRLRARVVRGRARFAEAEAVAIVTPSPLRRSAPCPVQASCGGCPWMVLGEDAQRSWKRRLVEEALTRIGGVHAAAVDPIEATPSALAYRNKVELTIGRDEGGRRVIGYHAAGRGGRIVDVRRCDLIDPAANGILGTIREFFSGSDGATDDLPDDPDDPVRLVLRRSVHSGRHLVAIRRRGRPHPAEKRLARRLVARHPEISGVVRLVARPGRRGGVRAIPLEGEPWLEEEIGGILFRIPAATFFQVNTEGARRLAEIVAERIGAVRHLIELYGGVGLFGLGAAARGAAVDVVEADAAAVDAGLWAAETNALTAVRFVRADALRGLAELSRGGARPDVIVADPPRTGLGPGVAEAMAQLAPRRIVLVGCDPATFARDVKRLGALGFRLARASPIDLFPQTPHVETVGLLESGRES